MSPVTQSIPCPSSKGAFQQAKVPDQITKLALHPEAKRVEGASGLSYLSVPENALRPDAVKHLCPLTETERYRDVLVTPLAPDGTMLKGPYEE